MYYAVYVDIISMEELSVTVCQWEIFNYIHNLLSMPGYSHEEKQRVKSKVLKHIRVSVHTHTAVHYILVLITVVDSGLSVTVTGHIGVGV